MAFRLQNPQELFFHDLCSMYDVEQKLVIMLSELAQESSSNEVMEAFREHQRETEQHVRNLEQCFQILNRAPLKLEKHTITGMQRDHEAFVQQQPSPHVLTMANITMASKSEYLEMAAYRCLIDAADALGLQACIPLFEQNLRQEEAAAQKLATLGHRIGREQTQQV